MSEMSAMLADKRRVAALRDAGLLTDTPEEAYDRFTRLAARIVDAPIALFTVITEDEQRFRSQYGLWEPLATERRTPLSHSFCQYVVLSSAPLEVSDAREHPVVRGNPAIEEMRVIAYLGMPLITRKGETLGSLCAIDHVPREWTQRDRVVLKDLAAATVAEVELRRTTREAVELCERLERELRELRRGRRR
jgi:GAF domain-containing protein